MGGVFTGQLLQDDCLPQGWMGGQCHLHCVDYILCRLENKVLVGAHWNCLEVGDVRGGDWTTRVVTGDWDWASSCGTTVSRLDSGYLAPGQLLTLL